jgi:hypothetical protein
MQRNSLAGTVQLGTVVIAANFYLDQGAGAPGSASFATQR